MGNNIKSGPQLGGLATSPVPSRGVPIVGKDQSGYITPAFSGFPIVGKHEQETKPCLFTMQGACQLNPFPKRPPPRS